MSRRHRSRANADAPGEGGRIVDVGKKLPSTFTIAFSWEAAFSTSVRRSGCPMIANASGRAAVKESGIGVVL